MIKAYLKSRGTASVAQRALAEQFEVSVSTINWLINAWERGHGLDELVKNGRRGITHAGRRWTPAMKIVLAAVIDANQTAYQDEMAAEMESVPPAAAAAAAAGAAAAPIACAC